MPEPRVVLDVRFALHGVDRAVARGDRAAGRLLLAHPRLVAPVDALQVRAVRALESELPADVADLVVCEVAHERAQRVRLPLAVRIRERKSVARRLTHRAMLRRDLALARAAQEPNARILGRELLDDRVRAVGRAVGGDDHLEPLVGVVERQRVLDPSADHLLLVVGGDDESHRGRHVALAHGTRPQAREHSHRRRVACVRPGERGERAPERRPRDHAASNSLTRARYRSIATTRSASSST